MGPGSGADACSGSHRIRHSPFPPCGALCSWIVPRPSAVVFYVARDGQPAVQRFHCMAEEKGTHAVASTPRSRGRPNVFRTSSGASSVSQADTGGGASISRVNSSATTASGLSSLEGGAPQATTDDKGGSLRLNPGFCEACGDPVAYSFGSPEVFTGVAQGCYPRGVQLREAGQSVDYFADRRRLSKRCHAYFSQLPHSEVSEAMFEALQRAGIVTQAGGLADVRSSRSEQNETSSMQGSRNLVSGSDQKWVHPWPIAGALRLSTSSARVKGMGSGGNFVSLSACGLGVEDKTGYESQRIPNPVHLTSEEHISDSQSFTLPPSKPGVGHTQPIFMAPTFKLSPYGAVLSRRPQTSQLSARRTSHQHRSCQNEDAEMPVPLSARRHAVSAPASAPSRLSDMKSAVESVPASDLLRMPSTDDKYVKGAAVVFDDGSAPRAAVADRISEATVQALLRSKLIGSDNPVASVHSADSLREKPTHTDFGECRQKARELLETGANLAGKRVGANGQVVAEEEFNQCKLAAPKRQVTAQALMASHVAAPAHSGEFSDNVASRFWTACKGEVWACDCGGHAKWQDIEHHLHQVNHLKTCRVLRLLGLPECPAGSQ